MPATSRSSSAALLAIINDILDLASIDAGALELRLENVDVVEAMRRRRKACRTGSARPTSTCASSPPTTSARSKADGRRVRQVLFNLLSNAIGFSEPGRLYARRDAARRRSGVQGLRSRPRHSGGGAGARLRPLREPCQRGSRHRGPGLGLSIVRALVELHGGRVDDRIRWSAKARTVTCIFPIDAAAWRAPSGGLTWRPARRRRDARNARARRRSGDRRARRAGSPAMSGRRFHRALRRSRRWQDDVRARAFCARCAAIPSSRRRARPSR